MIKEAVDSKYLVGCDTSSSSLFSLPTSHAYSVMGYYPIVDDKKNVVARLIHVRNPWAIDNYSGPWNDGDSRWTTAYKNQVPYANNKNDGGFFIDVTDFVRAFYYFQIGFVNDNWKISQYEVMNDTTSAERSFNFTIAKTQPLYIQGDFYDSRMYAPGCKTNRYAKGLLSLY